jgi:hypothetical protein
MSLRTTNTPRLMTYSESWWAIDGAGWAVEVLEDATSFMPCDAGGDAALFVSTYQKGNGIITPEELWEMSGKASPIEAVRVDARCGEFEGYYSSYRDEEDTHWRVWWLARMSTHLYITFNCPSTIAGRHDAVVDWMLSTLRAVPQAGE